MFRNNFYSRRAFCCSCLGVWSIVYHSIMLEYNYRYSGFSRQVREINIVKFFSTQRIVLLDMEGRGVCGDILEQEAGFQQKIALLGLNTQEIEVEVQDSLGEVLKNYFKYFHHLSAMKFLLFERCFF